MTQASEYIRDAEYLEAFSSSAMKRCAARLRKAARMSEAMQEFVDRCDRGEVRSRYTYDKFRAILGDKP